MSSLHSGAYYGFGAVAALHGLAGELIRFPIHTLLLHLALNDRFDDFEENFTDLQRLNMMKMICNWYRMFKPTRCKPLKWNELEPLWMLSVLPLAFTTLKTQWNGECPECSSFLFEYTTSKSSFKAIVTKCHIIYHANWTNLRLGWNGLWVQEWV